ncbi:hypothetical protein GE061_001732 [Apolygus lucorum]|uniref:Uncharacterized protein n=1 Tax=Apolygus lucorum TaxID=248454 RepID=A0A8S9Y7W9_APOLU|nr:hypothetical protein GE061_001732 [Apolygus lucorum]
MEALQKIAAVGAKMETASAKIQSIARYGREASKDLTKVGLFRGMMEEIRTHYKDFKDHWNCLIDAHVEAGSLKDFPSSQEKLNHQECDREKLYATAGDRAQVLAELDSDRKDGGNPMGA